MVDRYGDFKEWLRYAIISKKYLPFNLLIQEDIDLLFDAFEEESLEFDEDKVKDDISFDIEPYTYEGFKKWFMDLEKLPTKVVHLTNDYPVPYPTLYTTLEVDKEKVFKNFEDELKEQQKENQIKKVLDKYIPEIKICGVDMEEFQLNGTVDDCYKELKDKDLI